MFDMDCVSESDVLAASRLVNNDRRFAAQSSQAGKKSRKTSGTRVQKLICRTQISNGVDKLDPNTKRIKITFISIAYFY